MPVRPSRSADVSRLIDDLITGDSIRRESAGARLAVIGSAVTPKLLAVVRDSTIGTDARAAALRALGAIGDVRAVAVATALLDRGEAALALDAIELLGGLAERREPEATTAFDRLAGLALNTNVPVEQRLAAIAVLEGQPEKVMRPLYEALARDPASRVVARIVRRQAGEMLSLTELVDRGLSDDPAFVSATIREDGPDTKTATLGRAIERARQREATSRGDTQALWRAVRGQLHQVLAERGSRIALYDVRETFERARGPLPVGFVSAVGAIGDTSCLEPLAAAWVDAPLEDRWWRDHLAEAFGAIVTREGVTRGHRTLQKILKRWPATGVLIARARA